MIAPARSDAQPRTIQVTERISNRRCDLFLNSVLCRQHAGLRLASLGGRSTIAVVCSKGLLKQVLSLASRSNSALVTDACGRRSRAFYSAAQRRR